jgi:hypothetical protein
MGKEGRRSMLCRLIVIVDIRRVELAEDLVTTREEGPKDTKQDNQENYASGDGDRDQDDNASSKEIC